MSNPETCVRNPESRYVVSPLAHGAPGRRHLHRVRAGRRADRHREHGVRDFELICAYDLYVAARPPNLVVGTVGGGTSLPTQRECLALLGCDGEGSARKFAEIVGATLAAGEFAICAALANGRFMRRTGAAA